MFFDTWTGLLRVVAVGVPAYAALVLLLRISGKRTLSKMNAFDFVVTVALGSTLATVLLSKGVALAEGIVAFALLIFLQYVITWLSIRSPLVRRLVKADPTLLLHKGEPVEEALKATRVTREEVNAAVRMSGIDSLHKVDAVVLETDGSFTVLKRVEGPDSGTLANVALPAESHQQAR